MDRVPYRRVTPSRRDYGTASSEYRHNAHPSSNDGDGISYAETLIMQCIISGIIMVLVLVSGMTDIAPAVAVRNGIRQVLTGAETLDELIADVRQFGTDWLGWDPVEDAAPPADFLFPAWDYPYEPATPTVNYENIYDTPEADEASNPTVPEPLVTPGLWD